MKTKTLFFALMITATGMFVSCAAGEGEGDASATDTTAVVAPVVEETPVVMEETTIDSTTAASTVDSTVAQ